MALSAGQHGGGSLDPRKGWARDAELTRVRTAASIPGQARRVEAGGSSPVPHPRWMERHLIKETVDGSQGSLARNGQGRQRSYNQ
jgi:hypothetical protein